MTPRLHTPLVPAPHLPYLGSLSPAHPSHVFWALATHSPSLQFTCKSLLPSLFCFLCPKWCSDFPFLIILKSYKSSLRPGSHVTSTGKPSLISLVRMNAYYSQFPASPTHSKYSLYPPHFPANTVSSAQHRALHHSPAGPCCSAPTTDAVLEPVKPLCACYHLDNRCTKAQRARSSDASRSTQAPKGMARGEPQVMWFIELAGGTSLVLKDRG